MCGIVGIMGDVTQLDKTVFNQMLSVDVLRGKHSTGTALIDYRGVTKVLKKAVNVQDFLDFTTYKDMQRLAYNCMIGHNRYATKGAINSVNAHPFDFNNIVGVHNGTLQQYYKLDHANEFDVDSECLYSHINTHGIQDAYEKVVGALALVWFDKNTHKLHFLRNSQRPLCYCYSEDKTTLYWASEPWMLTGILWRNGIAHSDVVSVTEDVLYSFDVPKTYVTKGVVLTPPKVVKLTKPTLAKKSNVHALPAKKNLPKDSKDYSGYVGKTIEVCIEGPAQDEHKTDYISAFLNTDTLVDVRIYATPKSPLWNTLVKKMDLGNFSIKVSGASGVNAPSKYLRADLRFISYLGDEYNTAGGNHNDDDDELTVEGYQGKKLTYTEFRAHTDKGCAWCGDMAIFRDDITWVDDKEFVCGNCRQQEEIMEWIKEGFGEL
jgi:predicted glutamine amidotransferase